MHHGLFVAREGMQKIGMLLRRMSHASDVALAKDPETPRKERVNHPVPFHELVFQEQDDGPTCGHSTTGRQAPSSNDI
jgi:hypothetical protein